ncbi:carboxylesterase type B [Thecamonas trahens ATCC 50062]|uniref:Carboxylic ester hydrolase n=1 Tax=Thecamonas trahens ATCC 50062 TaxID=461836 RepID=A0A0L0D5K9_THETB|nr:carboxylesterase type B [Thecamonas trahens ATCC 50062]KNC46583.1 carboxylesterase type B [Thecamonas trahens ATCC 50062]|eukprot:XP_013760359.1 carboxylesterase type B [Thecamonas trahens ATCC 50062]
MRQFLGVPFAVPPLGELRFRKPVPAKPWTGVLSTKLNGPACPQPSTGLDQFANVSEDCLYLDVYAPVETPSTPLPVVVYFYGGSWEYGDIGGLTGDGIYNGIYWNNAFPNKAIIVTTNYRLGPFGWLASPLLAKEDPDGSTGNTGLQDQRLALMWVQKNIAAFGGDPNKVTIWGESAGAGSVSTHLVSPKSWPYFHAAIMNSGPPANWTARSLDMAEAHWDRVVTAVGCSAGDVLACMRAQPMETLVKHMENLPGELVSFTPVVDGVQLLDIPPQLVRNGSFHNVPVMLGSNLDEGTLFVPLKPSSSTADLVKWANFQFGAETASRVLAAYPESDYSSAFVRASALFGDAAMTCPVRRAARWITGHGGTTHTYFFTHTWLLIQLFDPSIGVCHGSDLVGAWDVVVAAIGPGEEKLANQMASYWSNMVASHNPNSPTTVPVAWPAYNASSDTNIEFNIPVSTQTGLHSAHCDFWDTIYAEEHPPLSPFSL